MLPRVIIVKIIMQPADKASPRHLFAQADKVEATLPPCAPRDVAFSIGNVLTRIKSNRYTLCGLL